MVHSLHFKALAYGYLIDRVDISVLSAVKDYRNACICRSQMSIHLSLSDKTPVLFVLLVPVNEHRKLNKNKRHFGIVPVCSPLRDKHFQQLFIHLRLVVVRFTLIIYKALCAVGCDSSEHCFVKSACSEG